MENINNTHIISSTEYFNEAKKLYAKKNTAVRYINLALAKVSIAIQTNIYSADTPEDSDFKKGARYIGRTFFNVVEAIATNSYLSIGASALATSSGIATNYPSTENTSINKSAPSLFYFSKIALATIISCNFLTFINRSRIDVIRSLSISYMISRLNEELQQLNEVHRWDNTFIDMSMTESLINSINSQMSQMTQTEFRLFIMYLDTVNPNYTQLIEENEIIDYDKLKLYTGDALDPETLTIISQVALKDTEQPVIYDKQLYEYRHLATWHKISYPYTDTTCPHNRNKLIWNNVQRIDVQY
jgi:hypothetical protein